MCDHCSIHALLQRRAARCFLTFFIPLLLSSSCSHFPSSSLLCIYIFPSCVSHSCKTCLLLWFASLCLRKNIMSCLMLIFFPKCSPKMFVYPPYPINMSACLNCTFIRPLSPPLVLQDIRGGNRLLQPVLSNDLSGGAVLIQETGGLPVHHPHRRYRHVLYACVRLRIRVRMCVFVF